MKLHYLKLVAIISIVIISFNSHAALISYDLLTANSLPQLSYSNPHSGNFSSNDDGFQIYQQGANAPKALLDKSRLLPADNLGIITSKNTQAYFGIVDSVNPDNPNSEAVASWQINIENLSAIKLFIDMAAMGDFESSDEFFWHYSIDNNPYSTIFQGMSNESTRQNYRLENKSLVSLNDPMMVNSQLLSNEFQAFSSSILDTGNMLTLELRAKANGGSEAIAFQNILIQGMSNTVTVTEPKSLAMLLFAGVLFMLKRQFNY
tara:strand:+ start:695 stop:1480 length:786 start_codon:yes stop_codon:yes gene_type:complete